jgi:hypothetical protein
LSPDIRSAFAVSGAIPRSGSDKVTDRPCTASACSLASSIDEDVDRAFAAWRNRHVRHHPRSAEMVKKSLGDG